MREFAFAVGGRATCVPGNGNVERGDAPVRGDPLPGTGVGRAQYSVGDGQRSDVRSDVDPDVGLE